MATVENVAMLAADTARSRMYLQMLEQKNLFPEYCVVFGRDISTGVGRPNTYEGMEACNVDLAESLTETLARMEVPYILVRDKDINSPAMAETISKIKQKYIIYSGYGGAILRQHLFRLGKEYLHVHAGLLPKYRGSTTAYYSILRESAIGATAIFLSEGIDQGDILYQEAFPLPNFPVDIDYVYEPWTRARVLARTLRQYVENGLTFKAIEQPLEDAETYFIIHPVLKHLAMQKVEQARQLF